MTSERKIMWALGIALNVAGIRSCGFIEDQIYVYKHSPVALPMRSWVSDIHVTQYDYLTFVVRMSPARAKELIATGKLVPIAKLPEKERSKSDLMDIAPPSGPDYWFASGRDADTKSELLINGATGVGTGLIRYADMAGDLP